MRRGTNKLQCVSLWGYDVVLYEYRTVPVQILEYCDKWSFIGIGRCLIILSVPIKRAIGIWRLAVSSSAICRIDVHLFSHASETVLGLIITGNNPPNSYCAGARAHLKNIVPAPAARQ